MAEIIQHEGTWAFYGDTLRLTPGRDKNVSLLRKTLGELTVPLAALAGISLEHGKKSGRLRLRLRDGAANFDGEHVRLEWNWKTEDAKAAAGSRTLALTDIRAVEWHPAVGLENGYLRFTVRNAPTKAPPKYNPNSVELWGFKRDPLMALVAAAVQARRLLGPARHREVVDPVTGLGDALDLQGGVAALRRGVTSTRRKE